MLQQWVLIMQRNNIDVVKDSTLDLSNNVSLNFLEDVNVVINIKEDTNVLNILNKGVNINIIINVYKNAKLTFNHLNINNSDCNFDININLLEEGALSNFNNITIASNHKHSYNVKLINKFERTYGNIYQKAVCLNSGEVSLLTTGTIKDNCNNSENFQESRVLLLDGASLGEAIPMLLIDSHDVLAGHKASVSKVNDEELYYLQTRGISKELAESLLTYAFVKPVIDNIENGEKILEEVKKELEI